MDRCGWGVGGLWRADGSRRFVLSRGVSCRFDLVPSTQEAERFPAPLLLLEMYRQGRYEAGFVRCRSEGGPVASHSVFFFFYSPWMLFWRSLSYLVRVLPEKSNFDPRRFAFQVDKSKFATNAFDQEFLLGKTFNTGARYNPNEDRRKGES